MKRATVTRRKLLLAGLGSGLPLLLGRLRPWRSLVEIVGHETVEARLAGLLTRRASARIVGLEYLRRAPEEASVRELVASFAAGLPAGEKALRSASSGELRELLAVRTSQDFAAERTVDLRGWCVSRTEARLCAIVALVDGRRTSRT